MMAMVENLHRRQAVRFAGAMLASALALVATVALAQTGSDTTEQVLGNRRPLPLPTEDWVCFGSDWSVQILWSKSCDWMTLPRSVSQRTRPSWFCLAHLFL